MRLSELSPEAVRLILRLIGAAKGRMISEYEGVQMQNVPDRLSEGKLKESTFHSSELLGKTPIRFIHKFEYYVFHSIASV